MKRAKRAESLEEAKGQYLYSIRKDGTVQRHEITRWTPKTVYYAKPGRWHWERDWIDVTLPDGTTGQELRYTGARGFTQPEDERVSRTVLERDGEVCKCIYGNAKSCSAGYAGKVIPPGHILYTSRKTAEAIASGDVKQLRRLMAAVHPDRGATNEEFIAARKRYERFLAAG